VVGRISPHLVRSVVTGPPKAFVSGKVPSELVWALATAAAAIVRRRAEICILNIVWGIEEVVVVELSMRLLD
jgi:hypothetical protein